MKAKACTQCRQSKVRCDTDVTAPNPCTRCQTLKRECVFDPHFQSTSKRKRLVELEDEVKRLRRRATEDAHDTTATTTPTRTPPPPTWTPGRDQGVPVTPCQHDKVLGNVHLTAGQVTELFRAFLTLCHPYLPFDLPLAPDATYERCPLLFWVICAVPSTPDKSLELKPHIVNLVAQVVVDPPRSVEVVQALLILCMWPFPFHSTLGDPSFVYCGLATRIGLQIGLHRPGLPQEFSSRQHVLEVSDHVRRTTWMACYVVNQMQGARLGIPVFNDADSSVIQGLDVAGSPDVLAALCRISRVTIQFTNVLGASAHNTSGLLEPTSRVALVKLFSQELDKLQAARISEMSTAVEIAFLISRLQLLSFILHEDVPRSQDLLEYFHQAETDAVTLIQLAAQRNLSRCPFHVTRAVLYAALVLLKIVTSPFASQHQVLHDTIHLAARALSSSVRLPDDHAERWSRHLTKLGGVPDLKRNPPIRSRLSAWLVYDAIRLMKEHLAVASSDAAIPPDDLWDTGVLEQGFDPNSLDLDGINWDDLEELF